MMMTCDCTCKICVGFTFSSLVMGVFFCAVSHIIWKIMALLIGEMLTRDCDWESCDMENEMFNVEARCVKAAQNGFGEIVHYIDYDEGVLQKGVEEILQLEDGSVRGFNGFVEITWFDDQCPEGFKQSQVEEILQFDDQFAGGFIKKGVEEILLSDDQCAGGFLKKGVDEILQFDDQFAGGFIKKGVEEISLSDDQCVGGFINKGVEEILLSDDQCAGGFIKKGVDEILQFDDQCAGGSIKKGVEENSLSDDQYDEGSKQNGVKEIPQFNDHCLEDFKQDEFGETLQVDDQCVEGFQHNGIEEILQLDDQCVGGFKQNGFEKILQADDHCPGDFEHNDDQCVGGLRQNGVDDILQLDDQCVGVFSQDGDEENVTHLENHDEDQHISQFKEDICAEDQELVALDNSESDVQILDESYNVEVFSDGEAGSEELVSCTEFCVEQNALITLGTSATKEEQLEVNGSCFGTDHNVEDSLDSPKYEEKGLESPPSEDMTGRIEETAPQEKPAVEDMAVVTEETVASEDLNTKFEEQNVSEASIEHNNLDEVLNVNAVEGTFMIGEMCEIEEKKNALDKMLEELESKELEELCTAPNNNKQIYELMHDLSRDIDEENQVCEIVEDDNSDFNTEKSKSDHFKVADRIRDLKHDLLRLQYEFVSEESTSKSSGSEQRNSTMSRQSEIEDCWYNQPAPPSPEQGSSTSTSMDALYETYTERMKHFDRINNYQMHSVGIFEPRFLQKSKSLRLTSSFRQLSSRRKEMENDEIDYKLQKEELETVYVAQTCLTWEALHWQYKIVRYLEASSSIDEEASMSYDQAAEQFKQFQVLLQRFLENEHFNQGARIQEYTRNRSLMPKLLQVPALRASPAGGEEEEEIQELYRVPITISQFINIMEEAIMTFWDFIKADKDIKTFKSKKHQKLMDSTDSTLLYAIKRCLEKKESRVNDLKRRGKFLKKSKSDSRRAEEIEILLALIDMRIIARVLSMSRITKDHLRWCEEKLNALNVSQNKLHRDCMPVYFPS